MEFVKPIQTIGIVFAFLILLYSLWRAKANNGHKTKRRQAPIPSGAWPILGHLPLLGGQEPTHRKLAAMADKYGPAFMLHLGIHRTLVVSSWELVKDCFTTNNKIFATRPRSAAGKYMSYHEAAFGSSSYGPYWRGIRKIVTVGLLSKARLDKMKHVRISTVNISIKELYSLWIKGGGGDTHLHPVKVEMKQWFQHLSLNVSTGMIAGKQYFGNTITGYEEEAERFRKAIAEFFSLFGEFVVSDALPYCEWLDIGGHIKAMKRVSMEFDRFIGNWVEEHRCKITERPVVGGEERDQLDFIDVLLSTLPEDNFKSSYDRDTTLKATVLEVIADGVDTTSTTLTWALSLLLNNRQELKRAQDELDIHVGRDRNVEEYDIKNLVYLNAIVKETLRLFPPAPLSVPREAMEDCQVGGYHVPKGTRLFVNLWKLHRDPRVWSEANEFKPERFLTSKSDIEMMGQHFEFIPFGSGIRWCPGFYFATQVLHLTLARLLHGFNLDTPSSPVDMTEGLSVTLPKATPLEVLLSPRLPSQFYEE